MKTYSETMKSVLEKAAVITEEKQEKAKKTRSRLKTIVGAALAFALIIGAVLVIKPFGERGNAGQFGYGADSEKSTPAVEETPSCGGDPDFTSEPAEPSFITETAKVKRYDEGDTHNAELAMSMLTTDGYIYLDADGQHRNSYDTSDPVLRNCTPDYVREHSTDIELFELAPNTSVDYNRYFIRLGDTLYRYDPNHNGYYYNYMCLWDHDNNGVDDIVLFSTIFPGSCFMADVFDVSTKTVKQIVTRDMIRLPIFKFQFNGKNIYVNEKKLEYIGSEFYIGGVKADESILGATAVKRYEDGDKLNTERAMSMLKEDGYIDLNTGEVHRDYNNISDAVLRNCTPRHIRERSEDIELFQDESGAYFLRHLDKLYYSFGSSKICMCLWDYDKNGVDDLAFISNCGSGVVYLEASVFDLSAKSFRDIIYKNAPKDQPAFCFDFDGESIYIDGNKVEYIGGEFYIGGMKAKDYLKSLFDAENTPKPAEPIFITKKTEVIWNDDTYALNIDRFLTMLEADGYINAADGVKHKDYDIENSDFCNLTPEYFRESFPEIEVFCDQEHWGRAYFLRFGDKLYCYEGITLNNMCLWDYDGSGVDDLALRLYKYSDEGIAYQWIECLDAVTGELKPIFARRADFTSSRFVFDYDGKNIYVDKLLLEYRDGQAYIGTRLAADHAPSFDWAEHELISSERISVKEYANGSSDNVELAYSILRSSGFIFEDGRRYTELDVGGLSLRNCTSDYVIEKTDDIELFYNYHDWEAYFIRVGNELYRHDAGGGHHIYMLLWDYDKNGVDDVLMVSEAGSGTTYQEAVVFDVSTKEFKDIIHRNVYTDINFTFHFDGENIYIYLKKVEYKGGEFLIDGIIVQDYNPVPPTKEPEITPDGPNFIPGEEIKVKSYNDGDSTNAELACSMLEEGEYISVIDGSVYTDYTADASRLRNCTPDFIREKRADIELFQTDDFAYFLRIADKLYRFDTPGGFHMKMCLWDYDKNGIDDLVFYHSWGYGNYVVEASVLDVCMGTRMSILSRSAEVGHGFNLDYDAGRKMIFLYRNSVEYFDGEFYIGGMKVKDFCETQLLPQDTPEPTPSGSPT
ncbi:MAG: hypothetical protein IKI64_04010 [Clostridia bacterium]|nr:hypothetical protein [Clostridia bacterium]